VTGIGSRVALSHSERNGGAVFGLNTGESDGRQTKRL